MIARDLKGLSMFYDMDGKPMDDVREWGRLFERTADRRIGRTHKWGLFWAWPPVRKVFISTVWLGIDHSFGMGGPPLIFETMAFVDGDEIFCDRYATREAALRGHAQCVKRYWGWWR